MEQLKTCGICEYSNCYNCKESEECLNNQEHKCPCFTCDDRLLNNFKECEE